MPQIAFRSCIFALGNWAAVIGFALVPPAGTADPVLAAILLACCAGGLAFRQMPPALRRYDRGVGPAMEMGAEAVLIMLSLRECVKGEAVAAGIIGLLILGAPLLYVAVVGWLSKATRWPPLLTPSYGLALAAGLAVNAVSLIRIDYPITAGVAAAAAAAALVGATVIARGREHSEAAS